MWERSIDTTLHFLLTVIEENDDLDMTVSLSESETVSIKELSDGLAGELYSEKGWVARFSSK